MTRWPTRAIFSLTPAPIAATTPHGSWPPMTGFGLTGKPPMDSPPDLGRRYWCRSLPHMPRLHLDDDLARPRGRVGKFHLLDLAVARENNPPHRFLRSVRCQTPGLSLRFFSAARYRCESLRMKLTK